jgi:hypothetical protein
MAPRRTVLLLAVLGLVACGGNDKKDAEQTVRDFITATNKRDADKLCDDLFSKAFIEQATGASGDKAKSSCKQQFKQLRGVKLRLVRISKTKVSGDKATVSAVIETQEQPQPRVFQLTKEDGRWRLAGGAGG